jgi:hypothetical protein
MLIEVLRMKQMSCSKNNVTLEKLISLGNWELDGNVTRRQAAENSTATGLGGRLKEENPTARTRRRQSAK